MRASTLVPIALLALALRAWPLHVFYLNPDHLLLPNMAMVALEQDGWSPSGLGNPSGQFDVLRAAYGVAYEVGHATGVYRDRLDLFAAYVKNPFPFVLVARLWSCLTGVATVVVTALLATSAFGPMCGATAGVILATSFGHVRESHWGSVDASAVFFLVATLLAAERYRRVGRSLDLVATGVLAGCAAAFRYQLAVATLAPAVAVALRRPRRVSDVAALAATATASALTFLALSPYTVLDRAHFVHDLGLEMTRAYVLPANGLDIGTLLAAGNGVAVCALAGLGVVIALARAPRASAPAIAVALALLALVARSARVYLRYLLPLTPLAAVFAAVGVDALAALVPARRRQAATVALVLAAVAEPAARALALDVLLARPDTRILAATWIKGHVARGTTVLLPAVVSYANPELHPHPMSIWSPAESPVGRLKEREQLDVRFAYAEYGRDGEQLATNWRRNAYLVTLEHPVDFLGRIPPAVATALGRDADVVARFVGYAPDREARMLFEPIDASAFPLRGIAAVDRPGPNVTIYRLRTASAPPATPPSTTSSWTPRAPLR